MLRAIAAVVGGYVAMFVLVFVSFSVAYFAMGADRAFKPGSYDPSLAWSVTSAVLGLLAAVVGGVVCAGIAPRGSRAPLVLAGFVFVLGLAMAVPSFLREATREPRTASVGNIEAMGKAKTPRLEAVLNPIIGTAGVLGGACLRRSKVSPEAR